MTNPKVSKEKTLSTLDYLIECTGEVEGADADPELREGTDAIRAAIEERGRLRKFIIRLLCLFGRHSPAKETLKLAAADGYELYGRQVSFCGRCRKILFIGYYPPEHPNCRCEIVDPRDEDSGLPAPKEIIHQAMEEWQKKEDEKWR